MSSAPLVAIVTPVFNGAPFLAETMEAIQAQTYPNLVHIVLDNASTDDTPEILARYAGARVPVRVVRNERTLPICENWNAAVALVPAEAKYFRIMCADDLVSPDFVSRLADLAERHPSVTVVGCRLNHREETGPLFDWDPAREAIPGKEAIRRFFLGQNLIVAHQTLIRRTELEARKPFFDGLLAGFDTDVCLDMLRRGDWGFVYEVLATTRDHPGTQSRAVRQLKLEASDQFLLLRRYATFAFGEKDGRRMVRSYRRYYLRQLLRWRVRVGRDIFERHVAELVRFGERFLFWQFLDAIVDWPLSRMGMRPIWGRFSGLTA